MHEQGRVCQVCGRTHGDLRHAAVVRPALVELIRRDKGQWDEGGWICAEDLDRYRRQHVAHLLEAERGGLTDLDKAVLDSLQAQELVTRNADADADAARSLGQRLADRIADFGGSWSFIITFGVVLVAWMVTNVALLGAHAFDPFPFIFLNLILSCLAAIQAPVIMMSQNRQETRDRQRASNDYQVNLKAELEIRHLHQKLDHLLSLQWDRLVEIQQVQLDLMEELRRRH